MNIYQAKVVYAKIGHGTTTENYLVKAHNLTEAEVLIKAEVQTRAANDTPIEVKAITKKKFEDVVHTPAGKDTDVRYYIVNASSFGDAYDTVYNEISCEHTLSIVETDVLDFLTGDRDE